MTTIISPPVQRKRILVAPLDWGLGHATRCIPIINELIARNVEVVIAADNRPAELLKKEFPQLEHVRFPGYNITYPNAGNMAWTMFRQLPKLLHGIKSEHEELERIIVRYNIDAVISDNRWGAYSSKVPSIYIVNQLRILLSQYLRWGQSIVDHANKKLIAAYQELWIPDFDTPDNFLGELAHPSLRTSNTYFIGPISRLKRIERKEKTLDILVVLSGPEPQRTLFEQLLITQLRSTTYRSKLVRGTPERNDEVHLTEYLTVVNSMTTNELSEAIASAHTIISRPGHSTIMDLTHLGAKPIFVPTPQQTEQEYLAKRLKERKICYSETQDSFSLERAMIEHRSYSGFTVTNNKQIVLKERLDKLLETI